MNNINEPMVQKQGLLHADGSVNYDVVVSGFPEIAGLLGDVVGEQRIMVRFNAPTEQIADNLVAALAECGFEELPASENSY